MITVIALLILSPVLVVALLILYIRFRSPRDIHVADSLNLNLWTAVPADAHHSNTDLFKYRDRYLLAHATSPWHFASPKCKLVIRSSPDARNWEVVHEIKVPGKDVRDPKLAEIDGKLFLYFLLNMNEFMADPTTTMYCVSEDGVTWSEPKELSAGGWLFWRPKTLDGKTFYVPAYWFEHGKSKLFKSTDGIHWDDVGLIYEGETNDETAIDFRADGTMIVTCRLEGNPNRWGCDPEGHTLIGVASAPYDKWTFSRSYETRLDGPYLFRIGERTYACGRRQVGGRAYMGSVFGAKRTSLYLVEPDRLVFLSDLPSNGDTAYAGVVVEGDSVLISYYTSPIGRDFVWLMGMLSKSLIEMARFRIADLERLADEKVGS